jgi:hypothetical protein
LNVAGLSEERQARRDAANARYKAAVEAAQAQFAVERDAIDREFDKVFDDAREAGFVSIDEIRRLQARPRPEYREAKAKREAAVHAADEELNRKICAIFDRKP